MIDENNYKAKKFNFHYVRHGETYWNKQKLCQGVKDIELSKQGEQDATILSKHLKDKEIQVIISSPLKRAISTAKIIQKSCTSSDIIICDELKERNFGKLEGLPNSLMYEFEKLEMQSLIRNKNSYDALEIESWDSFSDRILTALEFISKYADKNNTLVVSHGRVFNAICSLLNST